MKTTSAFLTTLLTIVTCSSFGQLKEVRPVGQFTEIEVLGIGDVILSTGDLKVEVEAPEKDLKKIKSEVIKGKLMITQSKNANVKNVTLYITAPDITSIQLSGVATVTSKDTLVCDNLKLDVAGAGGIDLTIKCNNLETKIMGAGNVELSGVAIVHKVDVIGAGDLMAFDLVTQVTNAKVSGIGDIQINATEEVNVRVSGAGDVFLQGEPEKKNIEVVGAGDFYSYEADSLNSDTTKLKFRGNKFWIITDENNWNWKTDGCDSCYNENKHWAGFDMGVNGFLTPAGSLQPQAGYEFLELNYAKSLCMNINILEKGFNIFNEYFKVVTGLGFEFNSYHFDNNTSLLSGQNVITGLSDSSKTFKTNKLNTTFINIPLLLAFNTDQNPDKAFHLTAGVVAGYRVGTKYKQKYTLGNEDFSNSVRSNFNLTPYRLSARASVGYNNLNLYATYSLTEMFQNNEGPELHPFSIGLQIVPF
ncbi:MAG: outer membrane beta-barrel protein [Flavobacteriales bacterium]|nr:outer membrane beta-barrel protein [Flavobacteriales bacterium]MBT6745262.1 outer membrane beta-barrel protein [Flavobacteriales bacterium]